MQDKKIESALTAYAETVKPTADKILPTVFRRLEYARRAVPTKKTKPFAIFASALAALCVIALLLLVVPPVINGLLPDDNDGKGDSGNAAATTYSLADLSSVKADAAAVLDYASLLPSTSGEKIYSLYKSEGEVVVVSQRGRFVTGGGLVEYVAYADLTGGLTDYKSFANLPVKNNHRIDEFFYDGEWHTNLFYEKDDAFIYIIAMSPSKGAANQILFGGD